MKSNYALIFAEKNEFNFPYARDSVFATFQLKAVWIHHFGWQFNNICYMHKFSESILDYLCYLLLWLKASSSYYSNMKMCI